MPTLDATTGDTLAASLKAMQAGLSAADAAALGRAVLDVARPELNAALKQEVAKGLAGAFAGKAPTDDFSDTMLAVIRSKEQGKTAVEILEMANQSPTSD